MYDAVAVRVLFLKRIKFGCIASARETTDTGTEGGNLLGMNLPIDVRTADLDVPVTVQSPENYFSLTNIVTRIAQEKIITCEWTKKTAQQHIKLASLFVKFVGHDNPRRMGQSHIAQFRSFLIRLPKNYGKSTRDAGRSVADLMSRSKVSNAPFNGLSNGTINRHMTQMANIVNLCSHAGVPFSSYHGVSGLRVRKSSNTRSERGKFSTAEIESIFKLPVWQGCASGSDRLKPGPVLIHDSLYWLPILAAYTGARRAELCDLLTSDIRFSEPHNCYYVDIGPREHRRLKNIQSQRQIPLHQELIRLGFVAYVEALRDEAFLFPDLRRGSGKTSAGDVFNKSWQKIRAASLPNAKAENKVFHSFRHWCNNEMKQIGVSAEIRKDLLGHTNNGVNEGRYTETARLGLMVDALQRLPTPTASVRSAPINLDG
ncbi:site-specific integrase [Shinella sumterensis]|uniref:site-specific integrase n=1 Tax=Shinella sumterensis TaxID=1967501 RepID=UPI003F8780A8